MKSKLLSISLLLLASASYGQTPPCAPNIACVNWGASTGWDNGSTYGAGTVVTYTVHLVERNGTIIRALLQTTGRSATIRGLPRGERCFAVTATVSPVPTGYNATSALSNVACKTLSFPGPTDGSIEAPTDGSIEEPNPRR